MATGQPHGQPGGLCQADPRQPGVAREFEAVTQPSGAEGNSACRNGREAAHLDIDDQLFDALAALPPRQRAALVLRYFLDLSEAEVAAALSCSLGTVKSSTSRGLKRLEETLRPTDHYRSIAS